MTVLQHFFVNATQEELLLQFAPVISKLQSQPVAQNEEDPEILKANQAIQSNTILSLTEKYAQQAGNLLVIPETQLESIFTLLLALIYKVSESNEKQQIALLSHVLHSLETSSYEKGSMKLRLLHHLFNAINPTSPLRIQVFKTLAKLAHRHGELKALGTQLPFLRMWVHEFKLSVPTAIELFQYLSNLFSDALLHKEAYQSLFLALSLMDKRNSKEFEMNFNKALYLGLSSPSDVLDLSNLLHLSSTLPFPSVPLLQCYVAGDVIGFRQALPTLTTLTQSFQFPSLKASNLIDKVCLNHLSRLPSGLTLTYHQLTTALQCDIATVEKYVIDASEKGLLKAKLNPLEQCLIVLQPNPHHFESVDWDFLHRSLKQWQTKIDKLKLKVSSSGEEVFIPHDDESDDDLDATTSAFHPMGTPPHEMAFNEVNSLNDLHPPSLNSMDHMVENVSNLELVDAQTQ